MEIVWAILVIFGIIVGLSLLVGVAFTIFRKIRNGDSITIPIKLLITFYLYVGIVAGLLVFTQGAASLLRAGGAEAFGNDFSYSPVQVSVPDEGAFAPIPSKPVELKTPADLSDAERDEISQILAERDAIQAARREESTRLGLDRAQKEGWIEGIGFTIIGTLIWAAHMVARRKLGRPEDEGSLLDRGYVILLTVVFGIITIVSLPQAVSETIRFALLDPLDGRTYQPGGELALSIVALPIWLFYLASAIRAARQSG